MNSRKYVDAGLLVLYTFSVVAFVVLVSALVYHVIVGM